LGRKTEKGKNSWRGTEKKQKIVGKKHNKVNNRTGSEQKEEQSEKNREEEVILDRKIEGGKN
jgi:hypothetical protein